MAVSRNSISIFVERWRQGESPSAQAVLRDHPELAEQKSVVLDLAYEEFCLRREAGEQVAPSTFCDQFPTYRKSLERLLGVHELLAGNSALESLSDETVWPEPGDEFLGFRLREELGKGALGRVFSATEPALGNRTVVLKLALEGGREAEILGKLKHEHIVPIHSVRRDEVTRLTAVCMPYLGTATLCDVIDTALAARGRVTGRVVADASRDNRPLEAQRRGRPSAPIQLSPDYVNTVLKIGIDLASALAYAHSQGILHRDLKPSNVLVASDGTPMLLDFNLSSDEELSELRVGATLPYAAPEQLAALIGQRDHDEDRVDARSDIFSLGVVLYELLSGGLPFEAPSSEKPIDREFETGRLPMEATARAILARQERGPVPLCRRSPSLDPEAAAVVERCLKFDPAKRPQSANELLCQLKRALSVPRRIVRWSRGHRIVSAAIVGIACSVLVAATVIIASRDPNFIRERNAGYAALKNGAIDEAIDDFGQALKDEPDDLRSLVGRAQSYMQLGDFHDAALDFKAATKISPAGVIRAWAGYCFGQEGAFNKAKNCNEEAVKAGFESPEIYNNWGYTLGQQGQWAAARERFTTALEKNPQLQPALFTRAMAEMAEWNLAAQAGRYLPSDPARKDFAAAIKLEPHCCKLLRFAAHFNMTLPDADSYRDETIDYLTRAIGLGLTSEQLANNPPLNKLMAEPRVKEALAKGQRSQSVERVTMLPPSTIEALNGL
jgi:serine/threonine protein kinase/Tfp pilus assembly protein PilF